MAKPSVVPTSILDEAAKITAGDRQEQYGAPEDNWGRVSQIASAVLGKEMTPEECVLVAVSMKLARLRKDPAHRDSQIDLAGYAWVLSQVAR